MPPATTGPLELLTAPHQIVPQLLPVAAVQGATAAVLKAQVAVPEPEEVAKVKNPFM